MFKHIKVRFHLRRAVAERLPQYDADFCVTVFSSCVFPLRRDGGGTEPGARSGSQEWVLEPFLRSTLRSGSGLETIGLTSLEVSKPQY